MPHLTFDIDQLGPIMPVWVGVSESMRSLIRDASKPLPELQIVQALVDTGASCSVIDPAVVKELGISPKSTISVHTPSTGGKPVIQPVYDVSIWLYHATAKHILERSFPVCSAPLRVQGIDMLLGRDMLGECLSIFDGPDKRFTISF